MPFYVEDLAIRSAFTYYWDFLAVINGIDTQRIKLKHYCDQFDQVRADILFLLKTKEL